MTETTKKKIIFAEDDKASSMALKMMLSKKGYEVLGVENGQKLVDELKKDTQVDLILTDLMMPIMDGYEAMKAIRKIPTFDHINIIVMTAKAMKGDDDLCYQCGANDYVPKPIDFDILLEKIEKNIK